MQQQRALAVAERAKIDQRIAALDVLIAQERAQQQPVRVAATATRGRVKAVPVAKRKRGPRAAVTLAEHIAKALAAAGGELDTAALSAKIKAVDGVEVSVRSLGAALPKMVKDGRVVRTGRGMYDLPRKPDSPAVSAGLSVVPN